MNRKSLVAGIIISVALMAPFAASALSIDDLQQQIRELLAKVATLQAQLKVQAGTTSTVSADASLMLKTPRMCGIIKRNLAPGYRGDDVRGLQEFLAEEGLLQASATGYFGVQTRAALAKWQSDNGVTAVGSVGPITRKKFVLRCSNAGNGLLRVSPNRGSAPLTVTVVAKTGDSTNYRPSIADGQDTLIDYGDGTERAWVHCDVTPQDIFPSRCVNSVTFTHAYAKDGVYTVSIVQSGGMCIGGCQDRILASEKVVVGQNQIACNEEYNPVCGAKPIVCITTPCNPIPTTYGNSCTLKADGATYLYDGACRNTTENPESNPQCKAWNDGCNSCGRSEPGGLAYCTLRACTAESMQKPYCTAYFDTAGNKPPVISGFSGPVLLAINEIGTWKITASDPENRTLNYSILWGDEWTASDSSQRALAPAASIQQQSSFTHSYARAGTYSVALTVTDSTGASARSTATVQVSQTACTAEYAPVCGRPQGCANTCPPGMYCALMCQLHQPQTYSNRCQMNNANADLVHEGVCTGAETY